MTLNTIIHIIWLGHIVETHNKYISYKICHLGCLTQPRVALLTDKSVRQKIITTLLLTLVKDIHYKLVENKQPARIKFEALINSTDKNTNMTGSSNLAW